MNVTKHPTNDDQAYEWAKIETHQAMLLALDLARDLELAAGDRADALISKVWQLHGASFSAGRLTGLPQD